MKENHNVDKECEDKIVNQRGNEEIRAKETVYPFPQKGAAS